MLLVAFFAVTGAGTFAVMASNSVHGSPEDTSARYFDAWRTSDVPGMAKLVYQAPDDFMERHLVLSKALRVDAIELSPGAVRRLTEDTAEVPFTGRRRLRGLGWWDFDGTLRLAVRDNQWDVLWGPETLHPLLKDGDLELTDARAPAVELVTADGTPFPENHYAGSYLERLKASYPVETGTSLVATMADGSVKTLLSTVKEPKKERTTIVRQVQAAAARALDGVADAAIVALRSSTGEIVAVADRLGEGDNAFSAFFPPGSTFKTIVAAALLQAGMTPADQVPCPGSYTIPFHRSFKNAGDTDRGTLSLTDAFAHSCNTTFVEQATTKLTAQELTDVALAWGFTGAALPTGVGGHCGQIRVPEDLDWFGSAAIGQGSVVATPLCMAMAAAAVESGTWRTPRIVGAKQAEASDGQKGSSTQLDPGVADGLREMMRAVVDHGTAAEAGLPEGVHGKTGTAEVEAGKDHAWFIGYRDDVAFCVFVRNGGSGRATALPIAARFLAGL
ncbi:penicillin-binding transpeptidase domain-containing protein [Nonomuraea sp. NBC_01738]|uniref:penicillin-binding transpeptidase domain-containing protein n=1 Tax=Nonomuraea sp. NBC_01738 TaxID=2976003 RepID=UPI002E15394B|nr:penicillin-binding transpeptidase domain-containing protein [Nonomuraea sp. NBC_01738]